MVYIYIHTSLLIMCMSTSIPLYLTEMKVMYDNGCARKLLVVIPNLRSSMLDNYRNYHFVYRCFSNLSTSVASYILSVTSVASYILSVTSVASYILSVTSVACYILSATSVASYILSVTSVASYKLSVTL